MDRRDFLKLAGEYVIIPTLIILLGYLMYETLIVNGVFDLIIRFFIAPYITIIVLANIFGESFSKLTNKVFQPFISAYNKIPQGIRLIFAVLIELITYLIPFAIGALFYHMWQEDQVNAFVVISAFMIIELQKIWKKKSAEKEETMNNNVNNK